MAEPVDADTGANTGADTLDRERSLLLVDDDRDFAESVAVLLQLEGYRVTVAHNASGGLAAHAEGLQPVVLVDLRLGLDDGIELMRALRRREPEVTVVMITAYSSHESTIAALKAGAYDYLLKPFRTEELLATLERAFERVQLAAKRRRAERELAARNRSLEAADARLRLLADKAPLAIALEDEQGRTILANARYAAWFGAGWPGDDLVSEPSDQPREIVLPGDGAGRRLLVSQFAVGDAGGQPLGRGLLATDITERHEAEERQRQSQRLQAMGQLTGGIAHDFNNFLAVMLCSLRLIEMREPHTPMVAELLEQALDATRSAAELTARLLAFGRNQPLHGEAFDLRDAAADAARLIARVVDAPVAVRLALADRPCPVQLDRPQLEASLLNLAINARDALCGAGEIVIAVERRPAGTGAPPVDAASEVVLSVADAGIGMEAEVRARALEPFFTTKPAGRGSGLGLSMVEGFVRQSGGRLELKSRPGRGTVVSMWFKERAQAPASKPLKSPPEVPRGEGAAVLLVEDNPRLRRLLALQLTELGYTVRTAADADAAEHSLLEQPPDLLLTDLVLPGRRSGADLVVALRQHRPGLPVLLISGRCDDAEQEQLRRLGGLTLLRKPVEPATLAKVLRAALTAGDGGRAQAADCATST